MKEKRKNNVMNYCCENIKRAYELIGEAKNILDWKPDGLNFGDFLAGLITFNAAPASKIAGYLDTAGRRMVNAYNVLCNARYEL